MKYLAMDTSADTLVVLAAEDGRVLAKRVCVNMRQHSAALVPMVDEVLLESGLTLAGLDAFGVVCGPGSFTGIRVGISTVKAFCYALAKPAVAVTSGQALAYNGEKDEFVVTASDAKQNKVYLQTFQAGKACGPPEAVEAESVGAYLASYPRAKLRASFRLPNFTGPYELCTDVSAGLARAVGAGRPQAGAELAPLYVRPSQADEADGAR